jgi:hypothetical protein
VWRPSADDGKWILKKKRKREVKEEKKIKNRQVLSVFWYD